MIYTMLDQRQIRWAEVVQMLYKCFMFAGYSLLLLCRPFVPQWRDWILVHGPEVLVTVRHSI